MAELSIVTQQLPKPDPNTYWVVSGQLLAGEYPGARDPDEARRRLRRFLAAGVRHFIDLTEIGELEPYKPEAIQGPEYVESDCADLLRKPPWILEGVCS